jgi:hypothetical protein
VPSHDAAPPAEVLERLLLEALSRPPCVIAFSGGRDSSLLLTAAVHAARRHGLPEPVAATLRFPGRDDPVELGWQERVMGALRLESWERIELHDELDFAGPLTTGRLERHGLLYPANACTIVPPAELASGGGVVTGLGGDELFWLWRRRRVADVAARRESPRPRDGAALALALAPLGLRRAVLRRRAAADAAGLPWLTAAGRAELARLEAAELACEPARFDRFAQVAVRRRDLTLAVETLALLAGECGAALHAPFADPRFAAAMGRAGGATGFAGRAEAMEAALGGPDPAGVLRRDDKAVFNHVFWTARTRRFAAEWSGGGLDERVVDSAALRDIWLSGGSDHRTAMLFHQAWLHDRREAAR